MAKYHTQSECRQMWEEMNQNYSFADLASPDLCENILSQIESIDKETPWSEVEPKWWLEMMEVQSFVINKLKALRTELQ